MANEAVLYSEQEKTLGQEATVIEAQANGIIIEDETDYALAATYAMNVKAAEKRVEEYWEPMRKTTYEAYKAVTDHKKAMLDPLKNAESILKKKMGSYQMEQERRRREEEQRLRKLAEAELDKKLTEAAEAEKEGNASGAEMAMAEAEVMDLMAQTVSVARKEAKVDGITKSRAWEIKNIDLEKLPCSFAGMLLRPADTKAVMQLIKASKGTIQIPGVEYEEKVNISVKVS